MSVNTGWNAGFEVQTTDATQTTLQSITVMDNNTCFMQANIIARRESDGASAVWNLNVAAKRVSGGNATIVGSLVNVIEPQKDTALLLCSVTVTTSGTDVVIKVTGLSGSTIDWAAQGNIQGYKH